MSQELSKIDFHHGEALLRVAGHYPTLQDVVFEIVQNALDVEAKSVYITVDFKKRILIVNDDGLGTTRRKFEEALLSVCCSVKKGEKLGQFGMGLIAPLGKCQKFTFSSTPKIDPKAYLMWTFATEQIKQQKRVEGIPVESLPELHFDRESKSKGGVPWRTQVKLFGFTKDRILSRLSAVSLREGILERFAASMRRCNTTVNIRIIAARGKEETERVVADKYEGQKLPVWNIHDNDAGRTTIQLYIAKQTPKGRRGKVLVGQSDKDFRIIFASFARHTLDLLDRETIEALSSGMFEGEILTEKAKLDPSRKYFQGNDALMGLCIAIENWFREVGSEHVSRIKESGQDQRYQVLGSRSMKVIEAILGLPEFGHLKDVVNSFEVGTIGAHHAPPPGRVIGQQGYPSISAQGSFKPKPIGSGESEGKMIPPETEHTGHIPLTIGGPKGRPRTMVKSNSLGLQFLYTCMEGSEKLWEFDNRVGVIYFNIRHVLWERCEQQDERVLMRLQERIALIALTLETVPGDWKEKHRRLFDDSMALEVFWLLKGDELAGRKAGRPAKKTT
jgi:hypothetical protein